MVELSNGDIVLENLHFTIDSKLTKQAFEAAFPSQHIKGLHDMHNGYVWYSIYGTIYNERNILLSLCFSPNCRLEFIEIYPQISKGDKQQSWDDWSEKQNKEDKILCDRWLKSNCGLEESNSFVWGSIKSFYDTRSGGSGIMIRYFRTGETRNGI